MRLIAPAVVLPGEDKAAVVSRGRPWLMERGDTHLQAQQFGRLRQEDCWFRASLGCAEFKGS